MKKKLIEQIEGYKCEFINQNQDEYSVKIYDKNDKLIFDSFPGIIFKLNQRKDIVEDILFDLNLIKN